MIDIGNFHAPVNRGLTVLGITAPLASGNCVEAAYRYRPTRDWAPPWPFDKVHANWPPMDHINFFGII